MSRSMAAASGCSSTFVTLRNSSAAQATGLAPGPAIKERMATHPDNEERIQAALILGPPGDRIANLGTRHRHCPAAGGDASSLRHSAIVAGGHRPVGWSRVPSSGIESTETLTGAILSVAPGWGS